MISGVWQINAVHYTDCLNRIITTLHSSLCYSCQGAVE